MDAVTTCCIVAVVCLGLSGINCSPVVTEKDFVIDSSLQNADTDRV